MNISDKALEILRQNLNGDLLGGPAWREHKVTRDPMAPATDVLLTLNCGHFAAVHIPDYYGPSLLVRDIGEATVCTICAS